jgi:hypothetical protein
MSPQTLADANADPSLGRMILDKTFLMEDRRGQQGGAGQWCR